VKREGNSGAPIFDFGNREQRWQTAFAPASEASGWLWFGVGKDGAASKEIFVTDLLRTNEWCHIAIVSTKRGAGMYLNGNGIGTLDAPDALKPLGDDVHNFIGKSAREKASPAATEPRFRR
jgi:hypothetical protein